MSKNLLVEIGLEEMPARFIFDATQQLANKVESWLKENYVSYGVISAYSTPRRLTVILNNVALKQENRIEEVRGPSLKIARTENGLWSKPAQGFAKGQGVELDSLYIKEIKNIEYIFAKKEFIGEKVDKLLPTALTEIITSMSFPKNMRWGNYDLKFIRPIRWLLTLFGDEIIPIEITGVKSSNRSYGHRFLGNEVIIPTSDEYETVLKEEYVIANPVDRKNMILSQINNLMKNKNWYVPIDETLLMEVVNLVEYPTILVGTFKEEFLQIPKVVLITTMKEHQRYFSVEDMRGNLLPYFITVRNGDNNFIETVVKGNEKVITARLADARFFYLEDQKMEISKSLSKLENIVFQKDLGTIGDKIRRIKEISSKLSSLIIIEEKTLDNIYRTAEICKFDLVTNMVNEFPELQGFMGEKYAEIHGENKAVSKGIYEHYLPRFYGDELPESVVGQIISITDKIDNIVGSFIVGKKPTGSQDPLGLRRQAAAIIQILLDKLNIIKLKELFEITLNVYEENGLLNSDNKEELISVLYDFFMLREKRLLQENGMRYDVIDAVIEVGRDDIRVMMEKSFLLNEELDNPDFKNIVDSLTRVINIADKAKSTDSDSTKYIEDEERRLYQHFINIKEKSINSQSQSEILEDLKTLKAPIDAYFDKVLVMTEDQNLRQQRLGLLLSISEYIKCYADFSKIVFD